jgi:hypothetical protein
MAAPPLPIAWEILHGTTFSFLASQKIPYFFSPGRRPGSKNATAGTGKTGAKKGRS